MFPGFGVNVGPETRRTPAGMAIIGLDPDVAPPMFPHAIWSYHANRYLRYWKWFNGEVLTEKRSTENSEILKYPLAINPIRNFSRKHASMLLGEETADSPLPLVRTVAIPLPALDGSDISPESERATALICQNIVNEVWSQSNGRGIQIENATLQQFLGGCVWKVSWQPWRKHEARIPIFVENIIPDFFLPIHESGNYWNLLEAYVVYRIPGHVAKEQYGVENGISDGWVIYVEHWTRNEYSIYVDGKPLVSRFSGVLQTYKSVKNPFGFVPFVYTPHLREGNFYGSSIVDDLDGLAREYNARMADLGDAIRNSVHRIRYVRNLNGDTRPKKLSEKHNISAINLGQSNPAVKADPEVWTEDPPNMSDGLINTPENVWDQLMREGSTSDVSFGEDEGSQRSGMTLLLRMWPSISHARMERVYWGEGLNQVARYILRMAIVKKKELGVPLNIPPNFEHLIQISQDFLPMVPRDRETIVNEVVLRFQAGLISIEHALSTLGDVPYIVEEVDRIKEWMKFQSEMTQSSVEIAGGGQGAEESKNVPTASLEDEN
jgi:hypothetical protein